MKKKIILFIPSIEGGGVEKNFNLIIKYLLNKVDKIYILSADRTKKKFSKKIIYICPRSRYWSNKGRLSKTLICTYLLIKNFLFKEVIILSFQSNVIAIIISKLFRFKVLIRLNTSLEKYIKNSFKKILFKFLYSIADGIIVNSVRFQKELNNLKLKSNLIYNLLDSKKTINELPFFKNYKKLKILNIGRLTEQKDQLTLIRGLDILNKKRIDFRCCIIGRGKYKNLLQKEIFKYKLNKKIKLIGYKKNAESYIFKSDLFVLTSAFEGLPNVLIEAQKYNIPIISSDCPTGPREILLNGKLGDLFPVGNFKLLSSKIIAFHDNKKILKKKSLKAKRYLNRFNPIINSKKYFKLLSRL